MRTVLFATAALLTTGAFAQDDIDVDMETMSLEVPDVMIEVGDVDQDAGKLYVALQTEEEFAKKKGTYTEVVDPTDDEVTVTFTDVTPGIYAVAVFQDTDENGKLSMKKNRPSEPYAFSGEVDGKPKFGDAAIMVEDDTRAEIELGD